MKPQKIMVNPAFFVSLPSQVPHYCELAALILLF